jgi:23S rRNA (cytidine1920-2'-O)/16S rRNA (cytidine1409-2'-O)-methyltransferase
VTDSGSAPAGGQRLDAALAARGLARSRTNATRLIAEGLVTVDGRPALKPALRVRSEQRIEVAANDHYVSRAAHKLIAALDAFPVDVTGRTGLDVGASTGGFTQVLLERGAASVIALDVGHEQLASAVRADERVIVVEGANARYLTRESLQALTPRADLPDLVVADLSFISLRLVLPALVATVGRDADFVVLIKPQFEVGRGGIREGLVHDPALREDAVTGVLWSAWDLGLPTAGVLSSPIAGSAGNREYLAWFSTAAGSNPTEWTEQVSAMVRA